MIVAEKIEDVRQAISSAKKYGKTIGFVPTMGALHDGHLSLVDISRQNADFYVMGIFINRIQFNEKSDFEKYPLEVQTDLEKAKSHHFRTRYKHGDHKPV